MLLKVHSPIPGPRLNSFLSAVVALALTALATCGARPMMTKAQNDFIYTVRTHAAVAKALTGVPISVTVAQGILESAWGKSKLTREANSLFGIKASRDWKGARYRIASDEVIHGRRVSVVSDFRAYPNWAASIYDHGHFLLRPVYATAQPYMHDPAKYARAIHHCGYATDPLYSVKLIQIMVRYDLLKYDKEFDRKPRGK